MDVIHAGLGADTLVVSENELAAGETYDGGGGIDTLEIHTSADFTGSTMQSLEVLSLASSVVFTSNQLDLRPMTPAGIAHGLSVTGGSDADLITVNVNGAVQPTVDLSGWVFTDTNDASEWDPVTDGDQIVINGGGLGMALTLTGSSSYDTITGGNWPNV